MERKMENSIIQYVLYVGITVILAIPLGMYIGKVMNGEKVFLSKVLSPCEKGIYRILKIDNEEEMTWKKYASSVVWISVIGFVVLMLLLMFQGILPLNPEGVKGLRFDLAFNTAISFITNTNWQSYTGESQISYLSQMMGLTVQNFVSAAVGISVLFALIRGFVKTKQDGIGNFWADFPRIIFSVLLT